MSMTHHISLGSNGPSLSTQFPELTSEAFYDFEKDRQAIDRLTKRGLCAPAVTEKALRRLAEKIEKTLQNNIRDGRKSWLDMSVPEKIQAIKDVWFTGASASKMAAEISFKVSGKPLSRKAIIGVYTRNPELAKTHPLDGVNYRQPTAY